MTNATPSRWCGLGLGALAGSVLFALRAVAFTPDSLNEAREIAHGGTFHPHHLLFAPIVRVGYLAVSAVLPDCDPMIVAQAHNAIWTALSVACAYWILEHELGSRSAAVLWALALPATTGYLFFATQAEAYVPAAGCLVMLVALLLRAPRGALTTPATIVLYSASVLYHQSAVLFAVPLLFLVRRRATEKGSAGRWPVTYAVMLVASGALVLAAYVLASGERSLAGALEYSLSYLHHPNPGWASWNHLSPTGAFRLLRSQLRDLVYVPGAYSIEMSGAVAAFALALAALGILAFRQIGRRRLAPGMLLVPGTWLAAHWAFFLWFLPGDSDHFVQTVFPLLLFAAVVLHAVVRPAQPRACLFAGVVLVTAGAAWNGAHVALPRHRDRGASYQKAEALARLGLVERSLVLAEHGLRVHLSHYFGARETADVQLLLQSLYSHGDAGATVAAIAGAERVVVPLRHVLPDYRVGPHSGRTNPQGWVGFLRLITDFEPPAGTLPATHAALAVAETEDGQRSLVIHPGERVVGDLRAMLSTLDELAGRAEPVFLAAGATQVTQAER